MFKIFKKKSTHNSVVSEKNIIERIETNNNTENLKQTENSSDLSATVLHKSDEHIQSDPSLENGMSGKDSGQQESQKDNIDINSKTGFFNRLKLGLRKTRASFSNALSTLLLGKKHIDDELLEEIETLLLTADIGISATKSIISNLTEQLVRKQLNNSAVLMQTLQLHLIDILKPCQQSWQIEAARKPYVILIVGVNGVGKTTTIGKLAKHLQQQGKSVMLAAGDTFRAAAVEQLKVWGERNAIPVIAQHTGSDSASVIYDAVQAARARNIDVLIADTAGRLHNKSNLMQELQKVKRVISKLDHAAPHEVTLVLDAGTGQNAIHQAEHFHQAIALNSIILTKLDGTAKGGVIFAIAKKFGLPIRFIGVGEQIDDLRPFVANDFVQALFSESNQE